MQDLIKEVSLYSIRSSTEGYKTTMSTVMQDNAASRTETNWSIVLKRKFGTRSEILLTYDMRCATVLWTYRACGS